MTRGRRNPAGRVVAAQRVRLLERDGPACWICRQPMDLTRPGVPLSPSLDHVIPASRGGDDSDANARLAHLVCNTSRGNRAPTQLGPQSRTWL